MASYTDVSLPSRYLYVSRALMEPEQGLNESLNSALTEP